MIIVPMSMPTSCQECRFCRSGEDACPFVDWKKWVAWYPENGTGKYPKCPLKEVPESKPCEEPKPKPGLVLKAKNLFFWRNPDETEERALSLYYGDFRSCGSLTQEEAEKDAGFIVFQANSTQFNKAHK